ncbi:MAG: hypothetical protein XD73_0084 [Anaerolinea thermophila]|uniref:Uncharacterized protein n=1 Tax=Anaerolinea thermophila TaxID=167964 RepID=A0A101FYW5_9CHLR|nr:MAG: hypothetical protein XD73_0084 [Anaerolinea thermophila]
MQAERQRRVYQHPLIQSTEYVMVSASEESVSHDIKPAGRNTICGNSATLPL